MTTLEAIKELRAAVREIANRLQHKSGVRCDYNDLITQMDHMGMRLVQVENNGRFDDQGSNP